MELDASLEENDLKWHQRAKQRWLQDVDMNKKYFHKCASVRKQKNFIHKLQIEEGHYLTTPEDIGGEFQSVFYDLFSSLNPTTESLLESFNATVIFEMNLSLTKAYTREEIEKAIFEMNPLGSPSPNGFPTLFFQNHWHTVGDDVVPAILEFLNTLSIHQPHFHHCYT